MKTLSEKGYEFRVCDVILKGRETADGEKLIEAASVMELLAVVFNHRLHLSERRSVASLHQFCDWANGVIPDHMTPQMHLNAIILSYTGHPDREQIVFDLHRAYTLGHEFGRDRAADVVDACNREGPYNAIGAAKRIHALPEPNRP